MTDELLTLEEVAVIIRHSPRTIYNWRLTGDAPRAIKCGRRLLFRRSDVEAWLEARTEADGTA